MPGRGSDAGHGLGWADLLIAIGLVAVGALCGVAIALGLILSGAIA